MTRRELLITLLRIRKKHWPKNEYIYFDEYSDDWKNDKARGIIRPTFNNVSEREYYNKPIS